MSSSTDKIVGFGYAVIFRSRAMWIAFVNRTSFILSF